MKIMHKLDVHLFWCEPKNKNITPSVQRKGIPGDVDKDILYLCEEAAPCKRINNTWEFCPDIFPIFTAMIPGTTEFDCDNQINHVSNIPDNLERFQVSHTYELEINNGVMTIYSDLDEDLKINIGIEEFRKFHKHYCEVRMTHEPSSFKIALI